MALLQNIVSGLRSLFREQQVERELDDELRSFLEMAAEEKMQQGMSHQEALRTVRLERGSVQISKETVRDAAWEAFFNTCWRDTSFAARMLGRPSANPVKYLRHFLSFFSFSSALLPSLRRVVLTTNRAAKSHCPGFRWGISMRCSFAGG